MIIYLNSQGNPVSILPTPLNQGSVGVNELTVIAPIPSTAVCFAAYELPNGLYAYPQIIRNEDGTVSLNDPEEFALTLAENMSNQLNSANGQSLNVWTTVIKAPITQSAGNLGIQIYFVDLYGNMLSSGRVDYPVNRGVPYFNPEVDPASFNDIATAVSEAKNSELGAEQALADALQAKQDAADYATEAQEIKDSIDTSLSGYLEKVESSSTFCRVYAVDATGTVQNMKNLSTTANPSTIPMRKQGGTLAVGTPLSATDAVNLAYFNAQIGNLNDILSQLHSGGIR